MLVGGGGDLNWSRIVPGTIRSLMLGEQPVLRSDGTFLRDYIYVDDVVDAYLTLGEALSGGGKSVAGEAFNFSDESPLSVMDIYEATCRAMGAGEVEPKVLNQAGGEIKDQYLAASKARDVLGWKARFSLEEGLTNTVHWYEGVFGSNPLGGAGS